MVKKEKQSRYLHGGLNFGFSIPRMSATRIVFLHHRGYESGDYRLDKYCTEETCLETVIGMDTRFYYQIKEYYQGILASWERGVGYLEKENELACLIRETPVKYWAGGDTEPGFYRPGSKGRKYKRDSILVVESVSPKEFREATAAPYSVVATMEPQRLTPVQLEENTLLGRKDDIIQAIDREELVEMYDLENLSIDSLTKTQKQLPLKARRVDLIRKDSVISAPVLRATPDNYDEDTKPPAQQGMIIYNTEKSCLQFYNGEKWVTLKECEED